MTTSNDKNITQVKAALNAARQSLLAYFEPERINVNDVLEVIKASIGQWTNQWQAVSFRERPLNYNQILNLLHECQDIRNRWAHGVRFTLDDTYRTMDTICRLLSELGDTDRAAEINRRRQELRRALIHQQTSQEQTTSARSSLTTGIDAANLRNALERFLTSYLGTDTEPAPFGGRQGQMAALDIWLNSTESACALLLAPAGRGKSALVSQWADYLIREQRAAVAFAPISLRFNTTSRADVVRLLGNRLAYLCQPAASQPSDTDGWIAEIVAMLEKDRAAGAPPLVVILDGLDEAVAWEPGRDLVLPNPPGKGVYILVTTRILANCMTEGWLRRLHWDAEQTTVLDLPLLDQAGIADVLQSIDTSGETADMPDDILQELIRLSDGDPLLIRLYVDDLRKARREGQAITAQELSQRPSGLEGFLDGWWNDQRRVWGAQTPLREPAVRAILNLLTNALGPLTTGDLLALAEPEGIDSWSLDEALQNLDRLVVGDGAAQGYSFTHPKLAYHLAEHLSEQERRQWSQRFLNYGAHTLAALQDGSLETAATSAYCVRFYRAHLVQAGADLDQFAALVSDTWFRAWAAHDGSYDGFLNDIAEIWKLADAALVEGRGEPSAALAMQCRCLLSQVSVNSLGMNMTAPLLRALVDAGMWTVRQALVHAIRVPEEFDRADLIVSLAGSIPSEMMTYALNLVRSHMQDAYHKARSLIALAQQLPDAEALPIYREVFVMEPEIRWSVDRAEILQALSPYLADEQINLNVTFHEAITECREIFQNSSDIERLLSVTPYLEWRGRLRWLVEHAPDYLLADVVMMVKQMSSPLFTWEYVPLFFHRIPPEHMHSILDLVIDTIQEMLPTGDEEDDAYRLSELPTPLLETLRLALPQLPKQNVESSIDMLLEQLPHIDMAFFSPLLHTVEPYFTKEQGVRARELQHRRRQEKSQILARRSRYEQMKEPLVDGRSVAGRPVGTIIDQAQQMIRECTQDHARIQSLLDQALQLNDPADRAHAILTIMPLLSGSEYEIVRQSALDAAVAIPYPTEEHLNVLLARNSVFEPVTPEQRFALAFVRDASYQGQALVMIALDLPSEERIDVLRAAHRNYRTVHLTGSWLWGKDGLLQQFLALGHLAEALDILASLPVSIRESDYNLAIVLSDVVEVLVAQETLASVFPQILEKARQIDDRESQLEVLLELAAVTLGEERRQTLQVAQQGVAVLGDHENRISLLLALVPRCTPESREAILRELLVLVTTFRDATYLKQDFLEQTFREIIPLLPDTLLEEALAQVVGTHDIDYVYLRAEILDRLVPTLSLTRLETILTEIPELDEDADENWLTVLFERVTHSEGVEIAHSMAANLAETKSSPWVRGFLVSMDTHTLDDYLLQESVVNGSVLTKLADSVARMPLVEQQQAAAMEFITHLSTVSPDYSAAAALRTLAPILPLEAYAAALDLIRQFERNWYVSIALPALVAHLPAFLLDDALAIARRARCHESLRAIADVLSGDAHEEIMLEMLQVVSTLADTDQRPLTQKPDNTSLDEPQFEAVRELVTLIKELPCRWHRDILKCAQSLSSPKAQANALVVLTPYLPADLHEEVLAAVKDIPDESVRSEALVLLTETIAEECLENVFLEAIGLTDEIERLITLAAMSAETRLSEPMRDEAIEAVLTRLPETLPEDLRSLLLRMVASHAAEPSYSQRMVDMARQIDKPVLQIAALSHIAISLPLERRLDLIDEILGFNAFHVDIVWERVPIVEDIVELLCTLPTEQLCPRWNRLLAQLRSQNRSELLFRSRELIPLLEAIGGPAAITALAETVIDHGNWFP